MSIESVIPSNHIILCCPFLLPSIFPSIRVFSNESALRIRCPKYWRFSFSISISTEYAELISFRIDWFGLFAVQGIPKSLLQHHCSKASVLWYPAFFMVQLSHPYMTTRKTIALTRWTFVGKVQETYRKEEEVVLSSQEHQQLLPQLLMLKITAKNQCCSFKERENQFWDRE